MPDTLSTPAQIIAASALASAAKVAPSEMLRSILPSLPPDAELGLAIRLPGAGVVGVSQLDVNRTRALFAEALSLVPTGGWPSLTASFGGSAPLAGRTFTALPIAATEDTHKALDPATGIYAVPQDGLYAVSFMLRLADADLTGVSYGIGVDTDNRDSPAFSWKVGAPKRQGATFNALMRCKVGDPLRAIYYLDADAGSLWAATLQIVRMR